MAMEERPFPERLMQDGRGVLREEFLDYVQGIRESSEEAYQDLVNSLKSVTESFLHDFDKEKIRRTLGVMDSVDLLDEIDILHALIVISPHSDEELYDYVVNTIRLVELVKTMILIDQAEENLKKQITLNRLNWRRFVF